MDPHVLFLFQFCGPPNRSLHRSGAKKTKHDGFHGERLPEGCEFLCRGSLALTGPTSPDRQTRNLQKQVSHVRAILGVWDHTLGSY